MKSKNYFLLLICLLQINLLSAQNVCSTFESGTNEGWTTSAAAISIGNPAMDGSNFMQLNDLASNGGIMSTAFNSTSYPNDLSICRRELCFDYKIIHDGWANQTRTLNPRISIYQGASPTTANLRATFVGSANITENSPWVHVCAPIHEITGSTLPSDANGQWVMTNPANWNNLIANVSGIFFIADIAGSSFQTEIVRFDNVCINNINNSSTITGNGTDITNENHYVLACGKKCLDLEFECMKNVQINVNSTIPDIQINGNRICFPEGLLNQPGDVAHPQINVEITGTTPTGEFSKVISIGFETNCCEAEILPFNYNPCQSSFTLSTPKTDVECAIWQVDGKTVDSPYHLDLADGTHEVCVFYFGKNNRNPDYLCTCEEVCITIDVDRPDYCFEIPDKICLGELVPLDFSCSEFQPLSSYRVNIHDLQGNNVWHQDFNGPLANHELTQYYHFNAAGTYAISVDFRYDCDGNVKTIYEYVEVECCDDFCFEIPEEICLGEKVPLDFSCSETSQLSSYRVNIHDTKGNNVWWKDFSGPLTNHELTNYYNFPAHGTYPISVDFRYDCDGNVVTIYHNVEVVCCTKFSFDNPKDLCVDQPFVIDFSSSPSQDLESYRINLYDGEWNNVWFMDFPGPLMNQDLQEFFVFHLGESYTTLIDFRYACGEVVTISSQTLTAQNCNNANGEGAQNRMINIVEELIIYPNPSDGIFNIKYNSSKLGNPSNGTIKVTDNRGTVVQEKTPLAGAETLDLSDFAAGVYFIIVETNGKEEVRRIIKQ